MPFLSDELQKKFDVFILNTASFFLAFRIAAIVIATPGIALLRKIITLASVILIGVIVGVLSNAVMGLAPISGKTMLIWMGLIGLGASYSFINIPFVPYIVNYYQERP